MHKQNNEINNSDGVSKDTVYSEMYAEMRRFRDYELTAATWYVVILLAILGAILTLKFGSTQSGLSQLLSTNLPLRLIIAGFATLIGVSGCYSVIYGSSRYHELRKYVDGHLEPEWKKEKFKPKRRKIVPLHFVLLVQILLVLAIDIAVIM